MPKSPGFRQRPLPCSRCPDCKSGAARTTHASWGDRASGSPATCSQIGYFSHPKIPESSVGLSPSFSRSKSELCCCVSSSRRRLYLASTTYYCTYCTLCTAATVASRVSTVCSMLACRKNYRYMHILYETKTKEYIMILKIR